MRTLTPTEVKRLELLSNKAIEIVLIEPTKTGLEKSIMDATGPVRAYLIDRKIHDYSSQQQGPVNKVILNAKLITAGSVTSSKVSLYRPITKKGDPRIWFAGLNMITKPNDILGITHYDDAFYVFNLSQLDIASLLNSLIHNPFKELVESIQADSNAIASELLAKLKQISARGPSKALLSADTAVGRTLEELLGININSSKQPDYKGIELKSFRTGKDNRKNLFAQVPDWELSKMKSSKEILEAFGYERPNGDYKLYCTVSTKSKNSQGLRLRMDYNLNLLLENSDNATIGDFVVWKLNKLHDRLLEKHKETFWIGAHSSIVDGIEYFAYKTVEHTRKPLLPQFDLLLEQGLITLDHLIKRTPSGKVVEKGPIFKLSNKKGLSLLFPPSAKYTL